MGARRTPGLAAFKQHFLPLPQGHGSFLPVLIFAIIAESRLWVMPLRDAWRSASVFSEKSPIGTEASDRWAPIFGSYQVYTCRLNSFCPELEVDLSSPATCKIDGS